MIKTSRTAVPDTQTSNEKILQRLKTVRRCRPDILSLAGEWSTRTPEEYETLALSLIEHGEAELLGILLNVATVNSVKMSPDILALCIKNVDNITDAAFAFALQDEHAVDPLLETALAEDISWERQAMCALIAAEISVKFNSPKQPVRRVLWQLSREIHAINVTLVIEMALSILDNKDTTGPEPSRIIEQDLLKNLPELPPPVILGGETTMRRSIPKLGRNEPCHCGSGKKYKKCCYRKDQDLSRDSSGHLRVAKSEFLAQPVLVNDTALIDKMRPYELNKLDPTEMNEDQLFAGYRRTELYGLREVACKMLSELQQRPGKEEFAMGHMADLFLSALNAGDREVIKKIKELVPEDDLFWSDTDRLSYKLLDKPNLFDDLEAICKKAVTGDQEPHEFHLLNLSYAFEKTLPAMSVVFGRAAIVSEPDRWFDNDSLMDVIERARISLDLEPWGDPIEKYLDWTDEQASQQFSDTTKDRKIQELQKQLAETKKKSAATFKKLRHKKRELTTLVSQHTTDRDKAEKSAESTTAHPAKPVMHNPAETVSLKRKIERLKDEISEQQADRRRWRQEAKKLRQEQISSEEKQLRPNDPVGAEQTSPTTPLASKKFLLPEFTRAFRKRCETLPRDIAARAAQAAIGFAVGDKAILQQTTPLETIPHYYRIRIGIHYRLLLCQEPGKALLVLDIIARENLKTWIRQHS